jgi:tape measure domain-containing protein
MAETVGAIQVIATINTKDYDSAKKQIEKGNSDLQSSADKTSKNFNASWTGAIAGVAASLTNTFVGAVNSSIGSAISRVDTLKNSSRTFENMGIDAESSAKAMKLLEKSIKGLPTPLDSAVRGMTSLTATYGNISDGQKVFSALNNAVLGFGGTASMVDNAITQLSQLPLDGPLDAQTWNSLRNSGITPVLTAMAKESGSSVSAMKEAFGSGELKVQDFIDRLVKMDKEGGGGLTSLEKIAQDSTKGIGTGFTNMQTAITRGMAKVITAVGSENISMAITGIGDGFTVVFDIVSKLVDFTITTGAGFAGWLKENETLVKNLAIVFSALLLPGLIAFGVRSAISFGIYTAGIVAAGVQSLIAGGRMALAWLMALGPIGLIIAAVVAVAALIFTNWEAVSKFMGEVWSNVAKWGAEAWENIKKVFGGVGGFFTDVWNTITKIFGDIGTSVGNAIGGAFKKVVNTILNFAVGFINGFIDSINGAIGAINSIPGVSIGMIGRLDVPQLAAGGITTGPTLAMIGEGKEQEAVLPLSRLEDLIDNTGGSSAPSINVTIQARTISTRQDIRDIAVETVEAYNEIMVSRGLKPLAI